MCLGYINTPWFLVELEAHLDMWILVKGGNYLEAMTEIDTVVFDKTGTLTKGMFYVTEVNPYLGMTKEEILHYGAIAESHSTHPIAVSIINAYGGHY